LIARAVGTYSRDGKDGRLSHKDHNVGGHRSAVAFWLAYIASYDFGLSREEIRAPALVGAGIIAALVAVEFFGNKLRKLK
jgi:hypothetical protein